MNFTGIYDPSSGAGLFQRDGTNFAWYFPLLQRAGLTRAMSGFEHLDDLL